MPIQFQCQSCRSTLRVPDNLAGRKVKCPKCGGVADVGPSPAAAGSLAPVAPVADSEEGLRPLPESEQVRVRAGKPISATDNDDAEEIPNPPPRPVRSQAPREEAISARPLRQTPPPVAEVEEEEEEDLPRPRRFKRRRRKRQPKGSPGNWRWIRWAVAIAIYLLVGGGISAHMIATGHFLEWVGYAVEWTVLMPITMGLFFASMLIASAISGGIDFGDLFTAIPKAFFLLAPMNFIGVALNLYFGIFVNFSFLVFGLIVLFGLDIWEAKFMIIIYMFLATGAKVLIILLVVAMMAHSASLEKDQAPPDDFGDDQIVAPVQKAPDNLKGRLRR